MTAPRSDLSLPEMLADWRKRRKRWRLDVAPSPRPASPLPPPTRPSPKALVKHQPQRGKRPGGSSQYRGVFLCKRTGKFLATFRWLRKLHTAGSYALEIDAAHAYDRKAREVIGPEAILNFPDPDPRGVQF